MVPRRLSELIIYQLCQLLFYRTGAKMRRFDVRSPRNLRCLMFLTNRLWKKSCFVRFEILNRHGSSRLLKARITYSRQNLVVFFNWVPKRWKKHQFGSANNQRSVSGIEISLIPTKSHYRSRNWDEISDLWVRNWDSGMKLQLSGSRFGIECWKFGIWDRYLVLKRIVSGLRWDRDLECPPLPITA